MADLKELDLQHFRDFESLEFYARQVVEGFITGLHKSPFHGFSVEFSEHRSYNPGESVKNVDWKLYGRTDRLYVKRYEEETNLRCRLLLDTSGSMYYPEERLRDLQAPNKFLFSSVAALALMNLFRKQRDAVGLSLCGQSDLHTPAGSTYRHQRALNTELYKLWQEPEKQPPQKVGLIDQLHRIAQAIPKRSLILVFSDFFEMFEQTEEFFDALQHLKHQKHELVLFWTIDQRTEKAFEFESRPYRFVDMESGQTLKLNPQEVAQQYRKQFTEFAETLRRRCLQNKIELVEADVSAGYHQVLQAYLIKRRRMRG